MSVTISGIDAFVEVAMPRYRDLLVQLVGIESVSQPTTKPDINVFHDKELRRVVDAVVGIATEFGYSAHVITRDDVSVPSPVLVTKLEINPSAPWLMVYNHLDVQPDEPGWNTPAFRPVVRDEYIIGRGATDDKGPMLAVMMAIDHLKTSEQLPVNVVGVYETQEENGSPGFGDALHYGLEHGLIPRPDSILVSDGVFLGTHPTIDTGLRGLVTAKVRVRTASNVIHSGLGGGVAMNPINILVSALSRCYDRMSGDVMIPEFSQGVRPLGQGEATELERVAQSYSVEQFRNEYGAKVLFPGVLNTMELLLRTGYRPTFEIHDITGGVKGTKIPEQAEAAVTMRLVGDQDPREKGEILRKFLQGMHPAITVEVGDMIPAVYTPIDNPHVQRAAEACERGYGERPLFIRSGGTIGAFVGVKKELPDVPIVMLNMSKATDGYHAPNEHFEWAQAARGMKTIAHYIASIGDLRTTRA